MAEFEDGGTSFRPTASPTDGPSPLGRRGYGSCTFCHSSDTVWQHDLTASLCTFRTTGGKGKVWAASQKVCDRCEDLYNAGEYAALVRLPSTRPASCDDGFADHLIALAAFCRADRGPRELEQPNFPPGFEPWEEYTGANFVFGVWPEHRRAVVDEVELVASPWPSLDLTAVFHAVWTWTERTTAEEITPTLMTSRAAEVLAWPETTALAWLAGVRHPGHPPLS